MQSQQLVVAHDNHSACNQIVQPATGITETSSKARCAFSSEEPIAISARGIHNSHPTDDHLASTVGVDANSAGNFVHTCPFKPVPHSTTMALTSTPGNANRLGYHARSRSPVPHRMRHKGITPSASSRVQFHAFEQPGIHSTTDPTSAQRFQAHVSAQGSRPAFDTFARYPPPGGGYEAGSKTPTLQLANTGSHSEAIAQMQRDLNALSRHGDELGIRCDPIRASHAYRQQIEVMHAARF